MARRNSFSPPPLDKRVLLSKYEVEQMHNGIANSRNTIKQLDLDGENLEIMESMERSFLRALEKDAIIRKRWNLTKRDAYPERRM